MNKNAGNVVPVYTGVLANNENTIHDERDIYKNASNCGAKKTKSNKYNIIEFEKCKSDDVETDASVRPQTKTKYKNKPTSKVPTSNSAITLIALIITVIVLLILAGVTLNLLIGENGIFAKANVAQEETNKQTATEKINLKITNLQVNNYAEKQQMPTLQDLADNFCEDNEIQYVELASKKVGSLNKIAVGNNNSIFTKLKEYPYEFEINSKLQLASINGVKIADNSNNSEEIESLKTAISNMQEQIDDLKTTNNSLQTRIQTLENSSEISVTTIDITSGASKQWVKIASYPEGYNKYNTITNGYLISNGQNIVFPYSSGTNISLLKKIDDGIYMYVDGIFINKPGKLYLQKVN